MLALLLAMSLAASQPAEDEPLSVQLARDHVAQIEVFPTASPDRPFQLHPEPVFRHAQNVRFPATGSVFLWLEESGRPAAVCDVFFIARRDGRYSMMTEWHSLSDAPLTARTDGRTLWAPVAAGLDWKPILKSPPPADSPAQRKRQARQIARRFTAHIINQAKDRYELRLITNPLFEYHTSADDTSQGGALFAFCQQTDPELLLVIEARKTSSGFQWHYAPAEFSNMEQYLSLDGSEVWKAAPPMFSGSGPHSANTVRIVTLPGQTAQENP